MCSACIFYEMISDHDYDIELLIKNIQYFLLAELLSLIKEKINIVLKEWIIIIKIVWILIECFKKRNFSNVEFLKK